MVLIFVRNQIFIPIFRQLFGYHIIIKIILLFLLCFFRKIIFLISRIFKPHSFKWMILMIGHRNIHRSYFLQEISLHLIDFFHSWLWQRIITWKRHVQNRSIVNKVWFWLCFHIIRLSLWPFWLFIPRPSKFLKITLIFTKFPTSRQSGRLTFHCRT